MRRRRVVRRGVLAAILALSVASCAPSSPRPTAPLLGRCATPAPLGDDRAGFSPGGALPTSQASPSVEKDLSGMQRAGAGWIRVDFNWGALERRPGQYRWAHLDAVVDGARCHGLRVLALPAYTPSWARARGTSDKYPPTDPARYAAFVVAAADHFGPRVAAWELWNEPDLPQFWAPGPNAAAYGRLLRASAAALRTAHPSATILSGGLAPAQGGDLTFLTSLLDGGGLGPVDGVAMHPYSYPTGPLDSGTAFNRLTKVHDALTQRGLGHLKVWATEMGAPTGRSRISVTDGLQAVSVTDAFARWSSPEWRGWTGALIWYSWRDAGTDLSDPEQNFGLVRHSGTPKPALAAYRSAVTSP